MKGLYLCYFGLREPLVQTQVLPYLRELAAGGVGVSILTFEMDPAGTWTPAQVEEWRAKLQAEGIDWHWRTYHKRPSLPATLYDIVAGGLAAARLAREKDIDVFHARSHVAAAMGALAKRLRGGRLIFDIRGFLPEEYVDAGNWRKGELKYRLTKRAEAGLLRGADGFVVLTEKARELLFGAGAATDEKGSPVEVIPCCVDLGRFHAAQQLPRGELRRELGLEGRRVIVYVGGLGGWYLTEEMAQLLAAAHAQDPATYSLILTQSAPELIRRPLSALGVGEAGYRIQRVAPADIPRYLRAADIGLSFIKPCYSKLASSPTKFAEYLASGLPVICNPGIGDVDAVVEQDRVGVLVPDFTTEAYLRALERADALRAEPDLPERCRASARGRFDLRAVGGVSYRRLYERVLGRALRHP